MTNLTNLSECKSFLIFATGSIESATFPLGPDGSEVFCRFQIVAGSNWELVSGTNNGISQTAVPKHANDKIVFNLPFECVFKSKNTYGWPQILVSIYAKNRWSVETTLGYCWTHFPIVASNATEIVQPIRVPKNSTVMGELSNWIMSRNVELKNPAVLLDSCENTELISMEKSGELKLSLQTICQGLTQSI